MILLPLLNLIFLFLTETWLEQNYSATILIETAPPNINFLDVCRSGKRGGGVAVIFKNVFQGEQMSFGDFPSFKYLCAVLKCSPRVLLLIIYRPAKYSANFFDDFTELLFSISTDSDCLVITGDFKCHTDDLNDMVFTLDLSLSSLNMHGFVSDHKCITFDTHFITASPSRKRIIHSRIFNNQSAATFCSHFSGLANSPPHFLNINDQISLFNNMCISALDFSAPYTSRAVPVINTTPWIKNNIRQQRRDYRKAERNWNKLKLEVHHLYMKELFNLNQTIKDARAAYFSDLIVSNKHNPRFLFTTINQLVTPSPPAIHASSPADCEKCIFSLARSMVLACSPSSIPLSHQSPYLISLKLPVFSHFYPDQLENYRPISKLSFLSKILEKIVADQLLKLVEGH
ncbi:hypothetical protein N1851_023184 [Merluccius polli]|uniref:Reverse transcriptase n=1 Tax=Merluccius polli TaxID=89951 RepID=A0AA47NWW2_MERPO|nr:hypothetical protein N1851_023184 [Merluccius polli]